jgi:hypothetical protein
VLQILNFIPAEEVFGAESRLVEQVSLGPLSGVGSLGGFYQIATAIIALLFIFILVRHFGLFRHLIESSFSKQKKNTDIHIFSSELKNIKIFTSLVGTLLLSLLVMRLSVEEWAEPMFASLTEISAWEIGGITLGAILALMLVERILLFLVGVVSERNDVCKDIWHTKLLYFSLVIILLSPLLILALLTDGRVAQIALFASVLVCSLSLVLFIKETFLLFRTQRFSIFHWFLYLCALEIFPLSLLLAPIVRG